MPIGPYRHHSRPQAVHRADVLTHRLGGIHRRPLPAFPIQEQLRIVAVESLLQIRLEATPERAERGPAVFVGIAADQGVQRIGISPDDVPDIGDAFEPAFDLE